LNDFNTYLENQILLLTKKGGKNNVDWFNYRNYTKNGYRC
jgi:hypothetical protein